REAAWKESAGVAVGEIEHYVTGGRHHLASETKELISLPQSDVLKYKLINDQWICIRPSRTEPKIKFYFGVKEGSRAESKAMLMRLEQFMMDQVKEVTKSF